MRKPKTCSYCSKPCGSWEQWPARAPGLSVCPGCVTFWRKLGVPESWLQELFGFHGTHYGPSELDL